MGPPAFVRLPSLRELLCGAVALLGTFVVALALVSQGAPPDGWAFVTVGLLAIVGGGIGATVGTARDLKSPRRRRRHARFSQARPAAADEAATPLPPDSGRYSPPSRV